VKLKDFDAPIDQLTDLILRRATLFLLRTGIDCSLVFLAPSSELRLNQYSHIWPVRLLIGVIFVDLNQGYTLNALRVSIDFSIMPEH
jgi:hypothetical protein